MERAYFAREPILKYGRTRVLLWIECKLGVLIHEHPVDNGLRELLIEDRRLF
jgi:hypothetical protein